MQDLSIHVTGLMAQADLQPWVRLGLSSGVLKWLAPEDALTALGKEASGGELWWFYVPPWSAAGRRHMADGPEVAGHWAATHRRLLRARQGAAAHVRLLSALRPPSVPLVAEALEWWATANAAARPPGAAAPSVEDGSAARVRTVLESLGAEASQHEAAPDDLEALLSHLYAWSAPEAWAVLEALEAANWDASHMPLTRDDIAPPGPKSLSLLISLLREAEESPVREAALMKNEAALQQSLEQAQVAADLARSQGLTAVDDLTGQLKGSQERCEALLLQLQQVQQDLNQAVQLGQEREAAQQRALSEAQVTAAERVAAAETLVVGLRQEAQAARQQAEAAVSAAREEGRSQVHAAQEESAQWALQLRQAQVELGQLKLQSAQREATAAAALAETQAAAARDAAQAQAQLREAQQAEELLREQLRQQQDEAQTQALREQALAGEVQQGQLALELLQADLTQAQHERDAVAAQRDQALAEFQGAQAQAAEQLAAAELLLEQTRADAQAAVQLEQAALQQANEAAEQLADRLQEAQGAEEVLLLQLKQGQDELNVQALRLETLQTAMQGEVQQGQLALELLQADLAQAQQELDAIAAQRDQALAALQGAQAQAAEQLAAAELLLEQSRADAQAAVQLEQAALQQAQEAADQLADRLQGAQGTEEVLLLHLKQSQDEVSAQALQLAALQTEAENQALQLEALQTALQGEMQQARLALEIALDQAQADLLRAEEEKAGLAAERDVAHAALEAARAQAADQLLATEIAVEQARLEVHAVLEQARAEAHRLTGELQDAQRTEETMLLHLRQQQQALEDRSLRTGELEVALQSAEERYRRLQSRYPFDVEVESVAIAEVARHAQTPFIAWRLKGLCVAGVVWPELLLRTTLEPAGAGVCLEPELAAGAFTGMDGPLVPKALVARQAGQLERFLGLSQQAWQVLVAASAAVDQALAGAPASAPAGLAGAPDHFDAADWRQSLGALAPVLRSLPAVFRYDSVRLRGERRASRYEHLWLEFEGAGYGAELFPGFSMRVAAVTEAGPGFSHLPQIEIPATATGAPPFAGWFAMSSDDYGPKLELRADTQRQAFDLAIWRRLPKNAQSMLLSAISNLPAALQRLRAGGRVPSRPWHEWGQLVAGLMSAMRTTLNAAAAQGGARPATPPPPPTMPPAPVPAQAVLQGVALNPDLQRGPRPPAAPAKRAAAAKKALEGKKTAAGKKAAPRS